MTLGRPIDPNSALQRKPWIALGMSKASYYWKKKYGDLPMPIKRKRRLDNWWAWWIKQYIVKTPYEEIDYEFLDAIAGVNKMNVYDMLRERTYKDVHT